ncbi:MULTISPECIES: phospholipase [unclassified Cryobacterium]|uniref:aggregation-promoting factor C-terminal-like domain-containing protein n=1 Tax=unclassified Cryobacterium TaxID=2649013 RepID=UPI002AB4D48E|nr:MULTISPECIES: phospholipase [unclassified Cryobacterium]MDY7528643.1 phospholipase [Cryobacterium sp. 10C2]MDY7555616.1 phospholipase [Cryobacterium sp. 10C3]MEB0202471.1 phospholipase [Cryobacterium sp. 5I3]MEB0287686.1 phospholipase [Cryobacterium sp. 10S3]MEB0291820.1 phospholipase [Cryobacterium sp. 10C2]
MNSAQSAPDSPTDSAPVDTRASRRNGSRGRRPKRFTLVTAGLAIAAIVAGSGFAVSAAAEAATRSQSRIAATADVAAATGRQHDQLTVYTSIAKVHAQDAASAALVDANQVVAAAANKVDASTLTAAASSLASFQVLPIDQVESLTARTKAETTTVQAAVAEVDRVAAEKTAAEAAAAAAARAAAEAQAAQAAKAAKAAAAAAAAAAPQAAASVSSSGDNSPAGARATASAMASSQYGWGSGEFSCLSQLWQRESGWNYQAYNSSSGATGIPQALPGSKMASAGSDWASNAATQISWGLGYIKSAYGTPCSAWAHSESFGYY